jgi:hypothetical protein
VKSNLQTTAKNSSAAGLSGALRNLSPQMKGDRLTSGTTYSPLKALNHALSDLAVPLIQPRLNIGCPDDRYEQEADRVADQVMRMLSPEVQRNPT